MVEAEGYVWCNQDKYMKRLVWIVLVYVIASVFFSFSVQAYELGVGAVADRLSKEKRQTAKGLTAPLAEVVVVDEASIDKVVAVAEVEKHGRFEFGFGYNESGLDKLRIFAVDEIGITTRVEFADFVAGQVLMPPTIANDKGDKGVRNLAIKGLTHPGAELEVFLKLESSGEATSVKVLADQTGRWRLTKEDLRPGKYKAWVISRYDSLVSRASQEIYFEIALAEVPAGMNLVWARLWALIGIDPLWLLLVMAPFVWLWTVGSPMRVVFGLLGLVWPLLGFKRRPRVGVVYHAVSKEPVSGAWVMCREVASTRTIGIDVTNKRGEFNFELPSGEYEFVVRAEGFVFPSKLIKGKGSDGQYGNLYHGEKISVRQGGIVELSVPLDPVVTARYSLYRLRNTFGWFGDLISWIWPGGCVAIGIVSFVYYPDVLHGIVAGYFALLMIYLFWGGWHKRSTKAVVLDSLGAGVSEVLILVYHWPDMELVATRVSDEKGEFAVYLDAGEYKARVVDERYVLEIVEGTTDGIIRKSNDGWLKAVFRLRSL